MELSVNRLLSMCKGTVAGNTIASMTAYSWNDEKRMSLVAACTCIMDSVVRNQ